MSAERLGSLTNDELLKRNVGVNLAAWALPAIAALASFPVLARGLGEERFGLLAFAWGAVGIFSLVDFGIGRALTRLVSVRLTSGDERDVADLVWAASWTLLTLTSLFTIAGLTLAPWIVRSVMHVPPEHHVEAIGVLRLLAIAMPLLAHGSALRGVLEAGQRFSLSARLRVPLGIVTYAGPLLAIPLGGDARIAVGIIVAGRVLYWLALFPAIATVVPGVAWPRRPTVAALRDLATVGGWITVFNIIGPVFAFGDRMAVVAAFPIAASGWYATAAEVATKQFLFTAALQPVLYPALAASYVPDPERAVVLMARATRVTALVLFPASFVLCAFAAPLLAFWMGSAFSPVAASVLPWLAIGVFVNALAQVPIAMLQGAVDARAAGVMSLIELPAFLLMLWLLGSAFGIRGVALAWLGRSALDAAGMWMLMAWRFPASRPLARRTAGYGLAAVAVLVVVALTR
ncbi:MAG: oligosaccharide flippase family protein [Gemmatimonadetes bacterium]|nr:oligosaccharide flippase family protein [Gemmatimonadota bacterium]